MQRLNVADLVKTTAFAQKVVQGKVLASYEKTFLFADATGVCIFAFADLPVELTQTDGGYVGKRLQIVLSVSTMITVFPCPIVLLTNDVSFGMLSKQTVTDGAPIEKVSEADFKNQPKPGMLTVSAFFVRDTDTQLTLYDARGQGFAVRLWSAFLPVTGYGVFVNLSIRDSKTKSQLFQAHFDSKAGAAFFHIANPVGVADNGLKVRIDMPPAVVVTAFHELDANVGKLCIVQGFTVHSVTAKTVTFEGKQTPLEEWGGMLGCSTNIVKFSVWNAALFGTIVCGDVLTAAYVGIKKFQNAPVLQTTAVTEIKKTSRFVPAHGEKPDLRVEVLATADLEEVIPWKKPRLEDASKAVTTAEILAKGREGLSKPISK
jgi:hypothetical protein